MGKEEDKDKAWEKTGRRKRRKGGSEAREKTSSGPITSVLHPQSPTPPYPFPTVYSIYLQISINCLETLDPPRLVALEVSSFEFLKQLERGVDDTVSFLLVESQVHELTVVGGRELPECAA